VLIIGGGLIGVEVANTLVDYGNKVTIVEMLDEIARGMELVTKKLNIKKLKENNVEIFTNAMLTKVENSTAFIDLTDRNKQITIEDIDIYVVAAGMKPNKELFEKLEGKIDTKIIGDANEIGDAVSAIQSAYFTCKEL
jgi:pyruvate/2-oxoglutarate dehydrogenase complex dihydrolipoamide dehydrogenase (E3) component